MKKVMMIILLAVAGKLAAQTPEVITSDKTGWHKIGEKNVDLMRERDEIVVMGADRFASLKVFVKEAPVEIYDLEVYYDNGDKQMIEVRSPIKAGGETRTLDLKGSESDLKKIVFVYKTMPNQKDEKARIEIWGRKTNENPNAPAMAKPALQMNDKTGWHKIGESNIDLIKDRDEIRVLGANRYASLKFKAENASIDLQSIEVFYESGENQMIKIISPLMKGVESRIVDLNGGERNLKKIVFVYKTLPNEKEKHAHIEVWGLKTNAEKN